MNDEDEDELREDRKAQIVSRRYYHFILRSVRHSSWEEVSWICDPVLALVQRLIHTPSFYSAAIPFDKGLTVYYDYLVSQIGLQTWGPVLVHTLHCTQVKSHLTLQKRVCPCGRRWWIKVHQHIGEGNLLKPTKMCSLESGLWLLRYTRRPIPKMIKKKKRKEKKQEAFRECRHLHVGDLWMWCWPFDKVKNAEVIKYNVTFWQTLKSVIL